MKAIITILLIISSSCQTIGQPIIAPQERCAISFQFNKCRCHLYDLQKARRITEAQDFPPSHCEDFIGFSSTAWAKQITPWARESISFYNDTCK